ncbi:carbohydrate-binding module family 5 protein [Postia placenta MAD-698-R-SB12]|uniref:chitinase n=1 Tax=Postia placenta MAD-698-R-SB12 TaxID=670580 RepID=A0A1X6NB71_9APHY|nr:carbohydrate-binding module family 5 protein [Postia placenta MAD-698-R-SB12]OSX65770.1 carbohydrate-binding module family 5 protein [Postia placenta MAD-698-R-SB12]
MGFGRSLLAFALGLSFSGSRLLAKAYDNSRSDNDDIIDAIPIAFLNVFFGEGGEPSIDLANTCSTSSDPVFEGTQLPDCSFLGPDIETCQSAGKIVTISLGGASGSIGFSNESQAEGFANTIWDLFLGGSSSIRPFGDAVLDGIDLDIEGGSSDYYSNFVASLRSLMDGGSKSVIDAEPFDAVYVQFSPPSQWILDNNYCELTNFDDSNDWDFATWDNWAKETSPNPSVKVYIGAPAASAAAGSGYVDAATLGQIAIETRNNYSSFGGVMLWDASQAYANDRYDEQVKNSITEDGSASTTTPTTTSTTSTPTPTTTSSTLTTTTTTAPATTTTSAGSGDCAGVATWVSNVAYVGGDQVVYNGDLWTANWWSYASAPGGAAGAWTDDGACASTDGAVAVKMVFQSKEAPLNVPPKVSAVPNLSLSAALARKTAAPPRKNSRFFGAYQGLFSLHASSAYRAGSSLSPGIWRAAFDGNNAELLMPKTCFHYLDGPYCVQHASIELAVLASVMSYTPDTIIKLPSVLQPFQIGQGEVLQYAIPASPAFMLSPSQRRLIKGDKVEYRPIGGASDKVTHSTGVIESVSEGDDGAPRYTITNDNTGKSTTYQEANLVKKL